MSKKKCVSSSCPQFTYLCMSCIHCRIDLELGNCFCSHGILSTRTLGKLPLVDQSTNDCYFQYTNPHLLASDKSLQSNILHQRKALITLDSMFADKVEIYNMVIFCHWHNDIGHSQISGRRDGLQISEKVHSHERVKCIVTDSY